MPASPCSLSRPLLNTSASTASSEPGDEHLSLGALLDRLPFAGPASCEADTAPTETPARTWASWWPRRRPQMVYLTPPASPTGTASPAPLLPASPFAPPFVPEARVLSVPASSLSLLAPMSNPPASSGSLQTATVPHSPGHTLGVLIGVLGCGLLGAVFGMQYAGRLTNGYEVTGSQMGGDGPAQGVATWMYLSALLFFGAKAACFGWAVAQLHRFEGWDAPSLWSATTRNIQQHPNSALRQRLHRRMALGVTVGVAQAAFCGWHYATLHNGGWRMAVFPYLLPVIDLPATWAATRCLFVPLADACGPVHQAFVDPELGGL